MHPYACCQERRRALADSKSMTREQWLEWVERHHAPLFRFAFRLSGSHQDAEDLVHDTFLAAAKATGPLRAPEAVRGWLFSILRNCFLMRVRRRQQAEFAQLPEDLPEDAATTRLQEDGPDVELLQRLLNQMPEGYRTPLILFFFEEFSYREIADQIGVPIGTVMSRLARAKDWIRQRYPWPEDGRHEGVRLAEPSLDDLPKD
jgi:RNA polymerase sigma-70 factor (ECF subfamily)